MIDSFNLLEVLSEWSYESNPLPPSVPRQVLSTHSFEPQKDLPMVIQGVRRCGKSTLLAQIIQKLELKATQCFFVNFEDPRLSSDLNYKLLDEIVSLAEKKFPAATPLFFFFDEIQNVEQWEKWFHKKLERPKNHFFWITGSNASLLGGKLGSALTGRHLSVELAPFSFEEYSQAKPHSTFMQYLSEGGFPRAIQMDHPEVLLREYFTDILERDVKRHVAARSSSILSQVAKSIFDSTGSETSLRKLAAVTEISVDTLKKYVEAFEQSYLISSCRYFSFSERQKLLRAPKYYPIDVGLRNALALKKSLDLGKNFETLVFHALKKKFGKVYYWRGKGEVDFVVQSAAEILPFQVTWEAQRERHTQAAKEFKAAFPRSAPCTYIHPENFHMIKSSKSDI